MLAEEGNAFGQERSRLARASQSTVGPSLEPIRQTGRKAVSTAGSLDSASQHAAEQINSACVQVKTRLDGLLPELFNLLDGTILGFQRKANEEIGNIVERVVMQCTDKMGERLHAMVRDTFSATAEQVHIAARARLGDMHEGLKGGLRAHSAELGAEARQHPGA